MKLTTDYGHVTLPQGVAPETLLEGTKKASHDGFPGPGDMLLYEGVRNTKMAVWAIRKGLEQLGVGFEYETWSRDKSVPETEDRLCFIKSLGGILKFGREEKK